jgi:triphosphatase
VFPLIDEKTHTSNEFCLAEKKLRSALHTDLFFGNLHSSLKREPFRAPWLDILDGIVELQTLDTLCSNLRDSDVDDKSDLLSWSETKRASLLVSMEKSKAVALEMETYW